MCTRYIMAIAALYMIFQTQSVLGEVANALTPVPTDQQIRNELASIHKLFESEYRKSSLNDRAALAHLLLKQAESEDSTQFARIYVLLDEAIQTSSDAGDIRTAMSAISTMASQYDVDGLSLKIKAISKVSRTLRQQDDFANLARNAIAVTQQLISDDRLDEALKMAQTAKSAALHSGTDYITGEANDLYSVIPTIKRAYQDYYAAKNKLSSSPNDTAAALKVGEYMAFYKNDWNLGIDYLILADTPPLSDAARKEQKKQTQPEDVEALANQWWDIGEKYTGLPQKNIREHARQLYTAVLRKLPPANQAQIMARIKTSDSLLIGGRLYQPGLLGKYYRSRNTNGEAVTRADLQIDFSWPHSGPFANFPSTGYAVQWAGFVHPNTAGWYTLNVTASGRMSVTVNDHLAISSLISARTEVYLYAGLNTFQLDYTLLSSPGAIRVEWSSPGGNQSDVTGVVQYYNLP